MILNFAQACYYLKNKEGAVNFTKAREVVKFQGNVSLLFEIICVLNKGTYFIKVGGKNSNYLP